MEEEHGSVWEDPAYYQEDPDVQLVRLLLREIVHSAGVYVPLHTFFYFLNKPIKKVIIRNEQEEK